MRSITGPELCRYLEKAGWRLQRVTGSHHIYAKSGEPRIISVPVHGSKYIKPGLAARIGGDAKITW